MLMEKIRNNPIAPLLTEEGRRLFPAAEDRPAWESIRPEHRAEILELAESYAKQPYPMRTATGFLAFVREGSRKADEEPYFFRRRKLCAALLGFCAGEENRLDDLVDGVWCICEESSWVISAHNVNAIPGAPAAAEYPLPDTRRPYVDLFSAQTGMILSFAASLAGEALNRVSGEIVPRIRREIRSRILDPFMETDDFWWMGFRRKDLCNWTPWIVSNVMYCAVMSPMEPEGLGALLERGCGMLDRWLDCVPADGGCDEGAGYWNMAGGAFLDCLELLERVTGGRLTFWQEEKIRNIMLFPLRAEIGSGWFLNFADCDARPFISGERLQTAGEKLGLPELADMGLRLRGTLNDQLADVPHFGRALQLLFHPAEAKKTAVSSDALRNRSCWMPDLQAGLFRRDGLTLCCKGGHNGESHNHNDVGSFMLYIDGEPEIVDAGNMTYTAKTFSGERYTLWNTRSGYHNLPLIGETEQRAGTAFRAREVCPGENGVSLEMADAYPPEAELISLRRQLALEPEGLRLTDEIQTKNPRPVTWVFLLRHKPTAERGVLRAGRLEMAYPEELRFGCEEVKVTDPRMARNWPGSLWRVCLSAPEATAHRAEFVCRKG